LFIFSQIVFLRVNGFYLEVDGADGHAFITGSNEFRMTQILKWIRQHTKPLSSRP
jgi:prophage maintenance system killer protein